MVWKECKAYFYCHGQVDLIRPFALFLFYGNIQNYNGAKVIQGHPAEDLKLNVFWRLGMKVCGSDGMLQVTEGSFLAPAEMVNVLDLFQGKLIWGEISNDVLIAPLALSGNRPRCSCMWYFGRLSVIKSKGTALHISSTGSHSGCSLFFLAFNRGRITSAYRSI